MRTLIHRPYRGLFRLGLLAALVGASLLSSQPGARFTKRDKAFFTDAATINFVRPGLVITVNSATISSSGVIQVNYTLTDPAGLQLDRLGVTTPGAISTSWVIGAIPQGAAKVGSGQYVSYINHTVTSVDGKTTANQATSDSGGTYTANSDGSYTYTFGNKAPAGYDATITTTIGMYGSRNLTAFNLATYYADALYNFVPNGSKVTVVRDVTETASCNQCHNPLAEHGGSRQVVGLCVICHQPASVDPNTGNTVDMKVMIHKIHMGASLPSVVAGGKYGIVGFQNATFDFSTVVFPSDVRNCTMCHTPTATQKNAYLTNPTAAACGSCHDDVNFATGVNHKGGPQFNDNECATCHIPQGDQEFDASILGGHTIPINSTQLPGTTFTLVSVANGSAGKSPTVSFTLKDRTGKGIPASTMNSLSLVIAGPTTDFPGFTSESAITGATCDNSGNCLYTFKYVIPATAKGTFSIGIEGYKNITLDPGTTIAQTVRDYGQNQVINFSVDGSPVTPRRTVVAMASCNQCHTALTAHGGMRNQVTYCVLCHNPNETDSSVRPATAGAAQGINFALMIHKIHTGTNLTQDYTVYGFQSSINNFNGVRFPGDLTDCAKCHVNNSNELPIAATLPVSDPRGFIPSAQPITSACTGCHDLKATASHALSNTSTLGEACQVCHGQGAEFAVDAVHTANVPAKGPNN